MRLLILLALCLLPIATFAQSVPPLRLQGGGINNTTVLHPAPGVSYLYDQSGNSSTVYQQMPGMAWYSTEDRHGTITSQGYVFDSPAPPPLQVPESLRYRPPESRETESRGLR